MYSHIWKHKSKTIYNKQKTDENNEEDCLDTDNSRLKVTYQVTLLE